MQRFAVGLLGGALLLASNQAGAQDPGKGRAARADALIQEAQALLNAGQVAAACGKFEASESVDNRLDTLLELADCYQRAGRTASAWHTFLEAEAVARERRDREHEQAANQRVAALEPQLTRLIFVVPTTSRVPGLTVRLGENTVPATAWGTPIAVDAGVQRVSAAAPGYDAWSLVLDASGEGRKFRINVPTLSPVPSAQAAGARGRAYRTAGIVTGSVGLAGLGAGAVFSAMSHNANEERSCSTTAVQCAPSTANKSGLANAAAVSFALGGTLVATGVTLFALAPGPDHKQENAVRVAARYANSGGRVQLEGTW